MPHEEEGAAFSPRKPDEPPGVLRDERRSVGLPSVTRVISLGRARAAGLACAVLLVFALCFARFAASGQIAPGLTLAGVDLGGCSAEEGRRLLTDRARRLAQERLRFAVDGRELSRTVSELGLELAVGESLATALAVGRSRGLLADVLDYLRFLVVRGELVGVSRVDRLRFGAEFAQLQAALIDDLPFAGNVVVDNGLPRLLPARAGRKISEPLALAACSQAVARADTASRVPLTISTATATLAPGSLERALERAKKLLERRVLLEAPGRRLELEPAELGSLLIGTVRGQELELSFEPKRLASWLAARSAALEAQARDATFEVSTKDEVRIVPSEPGVRLAVDAVENAIWNAAQSAERRAELPLVHEPLPQRSTEQAERLGIVQLVGSFTTRHPCCQPRVDNIHRIAALLDGLVVEPGQTVSVNAIVGPRTRKNGFVPAPSIEDGEMVDTLGGGVSQFATTLFNALFRAGYDISERKPHTYWFARYPMGIEATLSWPHPDIVFKNDSEAGLLVKASFTPTSVSVKLYGNTGGRRVTSNVSERREIVQPMLELLPNRGVSPEEEQVKEAGMIGWSVVVSRRVTFADGTHKDEKRKVTYKSKPRRIEVHPCRIPKGQPGATGEPCPQPELTEPGVASPEAQVE